MALSEIEKLERRYAENPQGLTFAPLAEIHRKNGEVQRALDLLGAGLSIHPDYIPASIVLGRCHMDLGNVQAAEAAFLHVLGLDGENVIALKALAEISERLLKFDDAERWLNTLLTVDRSNDDAREQLQRVEIARRQAGAASSAEPSSVAESGSEAATDQTPSAATVDSPVAEPADLEPSLLDEPFVYQPPPAAPEPGAAAPEPSEPPYVRRAEETRPPAAPPKRSYAVGETGGLSVAHLFKGILSARPPAQASAAPVRPAPASGNAGAPTRPAAEALSLSSVFGEEGSETPPAVPAANQGGGSVSFDDFFSSPSGSPASRTPRTPDPKTDDLDQFHAWLQNLKR